MKSKSLYIITGASRGLGKSLADLANVGGNTVLSMSRSKTKGQKNIVSVKIDLSGSKNFAPILDRAFKKFDLRNFDSIHIIHNAAILEPIAEVAKLDSKMVQAHCKVNLIAPILLTQYFLKKLIRFKGEKSITFISSGAAHMTIPHWILYCSTKAGLKMFASCLAADNHDSNLRVLSVSPGLMNTQMQKQIQRKSSAQFPQVSQFLGYRDQGLLQKTENVAKAIIKHLESDTDREIIHLKYQDGQLSADN